MRTAYALLISVVCQWNTEIWTEVFIHSTPRKNKQHFISNYKEITWQNKIVCIFFTYILSDRGAQSQYILGIFEYIVYPDKQ